MPKGRKRVAYRKLVVGLAFLGLFVTQSGSFSYGEALKDWFLQKSLLYRYVVSCLLMRTFSHSVNLGCSSFRYAAS